MKNIKKLILLFSAMALTVVATAGCGEEAVFSGDSGNTPSSIEENENSSAFQSSLSNPETSDSEEGSFDENGGSWTVIISGR